MWNFVQFWITIQSTCHHFYLLTDLKCQIEHFLTIFHSISVCNTDVVLECDVYVPKSHSKDNEIFGSSDIKVRIFAIELGTYNDEALILKHIDVEKTSHVYNLLHIALKFKQNVSFLNEWWLIQIQISVSCSVFHSNWQVIDKCVWISGSWWRKDS